MRTDYESPTPLPDLDNFIDLVDRMATSEINRGENDLSANLLRALSEFGLHGVLDTGAGTNRRKRPDVALYTDLRAADVGASADVLVEAKKPEELAAFANLGAGLVDEDLWSDKFVPYIQAHIDRANYFILTTFERFLVVPISAELRRNLLSLHTSESRLQAIRTATEFNLREPSERRAFKTWCAQHLTIAGLAPPLLSSITDLISIEDQDTLEGFASSLADLTLGFEGFPTPGGALLATVGVQGRTLADLSPAVQQALMIYTMAAHGGMTAEQATAYLEDHLLEEWNEFVGASIHSLVGRIFAIKTIEDSFCVGTSPPLITEGNWIFHSDRFDELDTDDLPSAFFAALGALSEEENPAVRDIAATGRFYDWLAPEVEPQAFRRLLEVFFSHSFLTLDGDLLGRFFELYAQRVDRRRRRQLGQYYTPLPIVRHMWRLAMQIAEERGVTEQLLVLDPGVGSGTFLIEGAARLNDAGIGRFWERLTGFDISVQAIAIAQVNVYLAILGQLDRTEADEVASINLYPTDSLDPRNGATLRGVLPLLTSETVREYLQYRIALGDTVKQQGRFPLVIGNPPYRNNSTLTLAQVAERFPMLLRSSRENARARERNIRDDYAWFFAAADYYVADRGLISFVVSDSFCYGFSYRHFREDMLRRYHVRHLINLGVSVFRDVGPRTQFVIIILEKRGADLASAGQSEAYPYVDLRPLMSEDPATWGAPSDPRLQALEQGQLPTPVLFRPVSERRFSLFPASDVVRRVEAFPVVVHGRETQRVFLKKWPGIITAFDELFRAESSEELAQKMQAFFEAALAPEDQRGGALQRLAISIRATSAKKSDRLTALADAAKDQSITYDADRLRKTISGSAPNEIAWYPDPRLTTWLYYEPRLAAARNVNEGRDPGWGTMSQWRDAESHEIGPKLVYTTSTNPAYGLKALVVPADWLVKIHGGESQQYNYTGLDIPSWSPLTKPNNLGSEARTFHACLETVGADYHDILFYIAGIYNSAAAEEYLAGGGANVLRIPLDVGLIADGKAMRVIRESKRLRNLHWLLVEGRSGPVTSAVAALLFTDDQLRALGCIRQGGSGGRFRQRTTWTVSDEAGASIEAAISQAREELDDAVWELFPAL